MNQNLVKINLDHLKSMTGDDNEFVIEILEMIEEQSPDVITEMFTQLESQDYTSLGATAHKYKSSINILGNAELINLMKDIENTAVDGNDIGTLVELVNQFEEVCNGLLGTIREELNKLQ